MYRFILLAILTISFSASAQTQTNLAGVFQSTGDGEYAALSAKHNSNWGILNGVLEVQGDAIYGIDYSDARTDRLDLEVIANCESYFFGFETRTQFEDLFDPRTSRGKLGSGVTYGSLGVRYAVAVEFNRMESDPEPGGELAIFYTRALPVGALNVNVSGFAGKGDYRTLTMKNRLTFFHSHGLTLSVDHYLYHRHLYNADNELLLTAGVRF